MARRPGVQAGVRKGPPTRGFPPGSAQALVALVLGVVLGVAGLQRGETGWAVVALVVAALGGLSLARSLVRLRRRLGSNR